MKKNFEPGRLLLVATLLMSLTLVSQLYVISESMDLSNGIQLDGIELSLVASYMFTALSMVIVINEFFQFKTKAKGLLLLNRLLFKEEQSPVTQPIINVAGIEAPITDVEYDEKLQTDEFEKLLNEELTDQSQKATDAINKYKTTKVKIDESDEIAPMLEEGALQGFFDKVDEETDMDRMLAESEVLATLSELNSLVHELKQRKAPALA